MNLHKHFALILCVYVIGCSWGFAGPDTSGSDKIPDNTRWPMDIEPGSINITPVNTKQIRVPSLYRLTRPQAEQILEELGLKGLFRTQRPRNYTEYTVREYADKIHAVSPEPGTWVDPGTQVIATLGPTDIIRIPYINGDLEEAAEFKINQAGLKFLVEETRYSVVGPYGVINWRPYDYCYSGDTVKVQIVYPEIPSVLGLTREDARLKVELAGLQFRQTEKPILTDLKTGHACEQVPRAGTHAKPLDIVTVVFPKERSIVPDFILLDELEVKKLASHTGLNYEAQWRRPPAALYENFSPVSVSGKVWKQDPRPGSDAAVGSKVKIIFGEEKGITIPAIYGLIEQDARKVLSDAGLNIEVRKSTQTHYAPRGVYAWEPKEYAYVGDKIYLNIEYPEVPQLRGMTKAQAEEAIRNAKLTPKVTIVDITYEADGVFEQTPLPGTRLQHGDTVNASIAINII